MSYNDAYIFSRLDDTFIAGAAMADLLADAKAAGDNSDAFLYTFGSILNTVSAVPRSFLIARDGSLIVGMLVLVTDGVMTIPGVAQVSAISTRTGYRKKGIASQLFYLAGKLAAETGKSIMTIQTAVNGHPAEFFIKAGFLLNDIEPAFSSLPDGRLTDTVTYWKHSQTNSDVHSGGE